MGSSFPANPHDVLDSERFAKEIEKAVSQDSVPVILPHESGSDFALAVDGWQEKPARYKIPMFEGTL